MQKNSHGGHKLAFTALVGLTAVVAAGVYLFYGSKNSKRYRAKVVGWMALAKDEVVDELVKLGDISEVEYHKVVEMIANKYKAAKNIDADDVRYFVEDLKKKWTKISKIVRAKKTSTAGKKK